MARVMAGADKDAVNVKLLGAGRLAEPSRRPKETRLNALIAAHLGDLRGRAAD